MEEVREDGFTSTLFRQDVTKDRRLHSGNRSLMDMHLINKNIIVVFDETIIGDSISLPLFIGERRKSGDGNININEPRQGALGCYIPFSMPGGRTPFRVFIFKTGKLKKKSRNRRSFATNERIWTSRTST